MGKGIEGMTHSIVALNSVFVPLNLKWYDCLRARWGIHSIIMKVGQHRWNVSQANPGGFGLFREKEQ
jgi:hypothetical protein